MGLSAERGHPLRVQLRPRSPQGACRRHAFERMRSQSPGRSATEGRPAGPPSARAAASPRRVRSASLRALSCPAAARARRATLPVRVSVSRPRSAATRRLPSASNQPASVPTAAAEAPRRSRPSTTRHEASPAEICSRAWRRPGRSASARGGVSRSHHGNQLQPTSLAGTTDCLGLTSELGLSCSGRAGADGHVAERAPADGRHTRVARNPSGRPEGSVLHQGV
jgi:hypothetical protein